MADLLFVAVVCVTMSALGILIIATIYCLCPKADCCADCCCCCPIGCCCCDNKVGIA